MFSTNRWLGIARSRHLAKRKILDPIVNPPLFPMSRVDEVYINLMRAGNAKPENLIVVQGRNYHSFDQ